MAASVAPARDSDGPTPSRRSLPRRGRRGTCRGRRATSLPGGCCSPPASGAGPERLFHQDSDQMLFEWMLARAARAWSRRENPLHSDALNAPDGVNLMANTSVLGLGVPLTPVTLLFGSQVAFLVAVVGCLAGTATAWYVLLPRRLVALPGRGRRRRALLRLRPRHDRAGRRAPAHGRAVPGAGDPRARVPTRVPADGAARGAAARADRRVPGLPRRGGAGLPGARRRAVRRRRTRLPTGRRRGGWRRRCSAGSGWGRWPRCRCWRTRCGSSSSGRSTTGGCRSTSHAYPLDAALVRRLGPADGRSATTSAAGLLSPNPTEENSFFGPRAAAARRGRR